MDAINNAHADEVVDVSKMTQAADAANEHNRQHTYASPSLNL